MSRVGTEGRTAEGLFEEGVVLFDSGEFFEAHEVWEAIWTPRSRGPEGKFLQALIQIAAAYTQVVRKSGKPAARLFRLALEKLDGYPELHQGVLLVPLRVRVAGDLAKIEEGRIDAVLTERPMLLRAGPSWIGPVPDGEPVKPETKDEAGRSGLPAMSVAMNASEPAVDRDPSVGGES